MEQPADVGATRESPLDVRSGTTTRALPRPCTGLRRVAAVATFRPALVASALAVGAGVWAAGASAAFFPHMSDNNDEAVYLLQADAIRNGTLFPPAPRNAEAFTPWLSGADGERFITKYTPVHPAFIAAARVLTGTDRAALAIGAAAAVLTCYLLAREVLASRRTAVLAAAFLFLSPVFLIQSAMFLVYLPTLALLQGFAASLLAGSRRDSRPLLALAGLLLGTALFSRPYDTFLFGLPLGVWWVVSHRGAWTGFVGRSVPLVLGAVPPLVAMLAYSHAATGNALQPVFTWLEPSDTIGFGDRRMLPDGAFIRYGPGEAWAGLRRLIVLTGMWGFGGFGLVAFAVMGLRRRGTPARRWLAAVIVTVPLGYALFWGSWGSTMWGGPWRFGPLYYMPVYVPLAVLAAAGYARLWRRDRSTAVAACAGMVAVTVVIVTIGLSSHRLFREERERLYRGPLAATALDERSVVFLPQLQGPWLLQPFALARNGSLDQRTVWALDRGDPSNFAVLDEFGDRTPYRVVAHPLPGDPGRPTILNYVTRLERMEVAAGSEVVVPLEIRNPTRDRRLQLDVAAAGRTDTYLVDAVPGERVLGGYALVLGRSAALRGPWLARATVTGPGTEDDVVVTVRGGAAGSTNATLAQRRFAVRRTADGIQVLLPGVVTPSSPGDPVIGVAGTDAGTSAAVDRGRAPSPAPPVALPLMR